MVLSKNIYSPQNFLELLTDKCFVIGDYPIDDIHEILTSEGIEDSENKTLWDYPLDEIDEIVENDCDVVLVDVSGFDEDDKWCAEWRWFEVPNYLIDRFR